MTLDEAITAIDTRLSTCAWEEDGTCSEQFPDERKAWRVVMATIDALKADLEKAEQFIYSLDPCPKCWGMESAQGEPCTCSTAARVVAAEAENKRLRYAIRVLLSRRAAVPIGQITDADVIDYCRGISLSANQ